jgi:heat shock protein HslJ
MRRSLLLLLAAAALAAPGTALAADPTPVAPGPAVVARAFEITGMVVGGRKLDIPGKLLLQGSQLTASVGCNTIGGPVAIDGNVVTAGPLMTTEMGCPGDVGEAEAALIRFLTAGPITMTTGQWANAAGTLFVRDAGLVPEPVPSGPPDVTVTSPPEPAVVIPSGDPLAGITLQDCVGILPADELPGMAGGTGGGSSGSGSGGAGTSGGAVAPGSAGGSEPGSKAVPAPSAGDLVGGGPVASATVDQAPGVTATAGTAPASTPATVPAVPPAAPDASSVPPVEPSLGVPPVPVPAVDPAPVPGVDPTPVPGGRTPTLAECRELVARIRTAIPPAGAATLGGAAGDGAANGAPEMAAASDRSAAAGPPVLLVVALVLVSIAALGALAFGIRRRSRGDREADPA